MGKYDRRRERPAPRPSCPECAEPMETYQRRGLELERCTRCRGVWFDAFELAVRLGSTGIETDAWVSRDGQVVLDHDGWHRRFPIALARCLRPTRMLVHGC